jgi:DNA-binding transcriptional regulator LsrR (DeoR family)
MANSKLDMKAKQGYAEMLFLEGHSQKAIAAKVGVTEKTIGRWKDDGDWENRVKFENNTRKRILTDIYAYMNSLREQINKREEGMRHPLPAEADTLMKLTASINRMEEETTLHDVSIIGKELTLFVQQQSPDEARIVATWYDRYVKYKIKTRQ